VTRTIDVRLETEQPQGGMYTVRVTEDGSHTEHRVDVGTADYRRLSGGRMSPEELLRRTFEFLLTREPKEAILRRFDLAVVSSYFPDFERAIRQQQSG
jgi:hypothetical protein